MSIYISGGVGCVG